MTRDWFRLYAESVTLCLEAQQVIALRLALMATGSRRGQKEAAGLVPEKLAAAARAGMLAGTGFLSGAAPAATGGRIVRDLTRTVRSNRRRLRRGK